MIWRAGGATSPGWAKDDTGLPEMAVAVYDWALVVDHLHHRSWLAGEDKGAVAGQMEQLLPHRATAPIEVNLFILPGPSCAI